MGLLPGKALVQKYFLLNVPYDPLAWTLCCFENCLKVSGNRGLTDLMPDFFFKTLNCEQFFCLML